MNENFRQLVDSLHPAFEKLISAKPYTPGDILPSKGVYYFAEQGVPMYVGRSDTLPQRRSQHTRPGSPHNQASFANLIAMQELEWTASYKKGVSKSLRETDEFKSAFSRAKARVAEMEFRAVGEEAPTRQALLEIYCAVALGANFNSFHNH